MIYLVTGAPGQDCNWMCRTLLEEGHEVYATYRYSSTPLLKRVGEYPRGTNFISLDITDPSGCKRVVDDVNPDFIINLAAASHVAESFNHPHSVFTVNTLGVLNFLEIVKANPHIRFINASTSEQWGSNFSEDKRGKYQDELTPFMGNSPYAIAKIAAFNLVKLYRESYGLFACSSLCHNHESKYRGEQFVTRKITKWVGKFYANFGGKNPTSFDDEYIYFEDKKVPKLRLGNIEAVRDWSHSLDFMRGMLLMLRADNADDYVLASEEGHSVKDFLVECFSLIGLDYSNYIYIDPQFYRPCEVPFLQGRATKIKQELGWAPTVNFKGLVREMLLYDIELAGIPFPELVIQ